MLRCGLKRDNPIALQAKRSTAGAAGPKAKGLRHRTPLYFLNRVLGGLDRPSADDLPGRLGLEHHLFAREGVGALARLGRRLLDHDELREAGDEENPALLQLLVADIDEGVQHALDVALGKFGGGRDLLDHLRLRQLGSHVCSIDSGRRTIWRKTPRIIGFSVLPTAISLWIASESATFPGFFQVKALPTPEITAFARSRAAGNGVLENHCRIANHRMCGPRAPDSGCRWLRRATSGFENDRPIGRAIRK